MTDRETLRDRVRTLEGDFGDVGEWAPTIVFVPPEHKPIDPDNYGPGVHFSEDVAEREGES